MALDITKIKADNLLATNGTTTIVPASVTKIDGQNIWEYVWPNAWPVAGVWTVTLNADGFSIAKGTVLDRFSVTQGTFYRTGVHWETTESVNIISTKVSTLETKVAALETGRATNASVATLQTTVNNHTTQITALLARMDEVEVNILLLQNP
jgi:hypothetical protein